MLSVSKIIATFAGAKSVDKKEFIFQYVLKNGSIATKNVKERIKIYICYEKESIIYLCSRSRYACRGDFV